MAGRGVFYIIFTAPAAPIYQQEEDMKIIKESPLEFTNEDGQKRAGNIYYDEASDLGAYWEGDNIWQYVSTGLARAWQGEVDSLAQAAADFQGESDRVKKELRETTESLGRAREVREISRQAVADKNIDLGEVREELDMAKAELRAANGSLDIAQKGLEEVQQDLSYTKDVNDALVADVTRMASKVAVCAEELKDASDIISHLKKDKLVLAGQVDELEEAVRPLNPEDIVDLRGTCTVDELLIMREAGLV